MLVYRIAPVFLLLLIIALPFLRGPATTAGCLFLLLDYVYQVLSIAIFTPYGTPRYEASFYLLPLIVACMIFGQLTSDWSRKRHLLHGDGKPGLPLKTT
jgi:hypothetical protein